MIELSGLANSTISRWVGCFHAKPGNLIYIVGWRRRADRGNWSAVYALGPGMDDEPRPKAMSANQYYVRYRNKQAAIAEKKGSQL